MAHGRYTIVGKLADGGMAEIFLAMQHGAEGFQKPVVLKRVLTAFSADPQFRNMFLDEAHICMSLNHGNIVQVLDVGVAGERTFLVLELIEGWDLEQVMDRAQATGPEHPWPPSLALYVTAQICRGLAYAHAKRAPDGRPLGIVHRDVSPTNVLISEQGEVKLADFGIAKAESKREQTLAGVIKGKIGFMSPEQALGRPLDARADLFSVGTVMYLMLTGRKPFDAASELESMMLAQRAEYRPPEELNPYLSPEATAIVRRAMEREPARRYQSADYMLVDVERVLRSQYHSAGQTELKLWLAELARRDGMPPMGRARVNDGARPVFVDESGELSAGASLELSDVDASAAAAAAAAATAVALPVVNPRASNPPASLPGATPPLQSAAGVVRVPTPPREGFRGAPGSEWTPPPATTVRSGSVAVAVTPPGGSRDSRGTAADLSGSRAGASGSSPVADVPGTAASGSVAPTPPRLPRRSRVGLGFMLGAVCMLGAVFGIRWLAQWAGRERMGITHWYPTQPGSRPTAPPQSGAPRSGAGPAAPAALPEPKPAAFSEPKNLGPQPQPPAAPAAAYPAASTPLAHAAASPLDGGTGALTPPYVPAVTGAVAGAAEEDETRLLGRVVPDAAAMVGEDEAEESAGKREGKRTETSNGKEPVDSRDGAGNTSAISAPASPRRAGRTGDTEKDATATRAAATPSARAQPVQIRITTSPLGAVVRTKKQVLGRTPLAVRFNPGNTYELTFVKSGYVTKNRRLAVLAGKPQSISVAMKKSPPPPRRSFFHRR